MSIPIGLSGKRHYYLKLSNPSIDSDCIMQFIQIVILSAFEFYQKDYAEAFLKPS